MVKAAEKSFHLRLSTALFGRVEAVSKSTNRSLNSLMTEAVEAAFPSPVVDVNAVDVLLNYVASASGLDDLRERIEEVNKRFLDSGSPLRVEASPNGTPRIVMIPNEPEEA